MMFRKMAVLSCLLIAWPVHAMTNQQLKAKPPKVSWVAAVDTETAISCLLDNNSFSVQTIRKPGFVDMAMYSSGYRMILATITPKDQGVIVEVRGSFAIAAQRAKPCMGVEQDMRKIPMLG